MCNKLDKEFKERKGELKNELDRAKNDLRQQLDIDLMKLEIEGTFDDSERIEKRGDIYCQRGRFKGCR